MCHSRSEGEGGTEASQKEKGWLMVSPDHSSPSNYLSSVTTYFINSLLRGHLSECLLDFSLNLQSFLQLFTETLKLVKGSLIQAKDETVNSRQIWCQAATGLADISPAYHTALQIGRTLRKRIICPTLLPMSEGCKDAIWLTDAYFCFPSGHNDRGRKLSQGNGINKLGQGEVNQVGMEKKQTGRNGVPSHHIVEQMALKAMLQENKDTLEGHQVWLMFTGRILSSKSVLNSFIR